MHIVKLAILTPERVELYSNLVGKNFHICLGIGRCSVCATCVSIPCRRSAHTPFTKVQKRSKNQSRTTTYKPFYTEFAISVGGAVLLHR